ncbi:MAG: NTP transferase domain-containing protein [Bacteroidales bacterium]|jgi:NDP-sugar pyrophosphorylase family protein|nr:NTP transferase domain-containing protein [Bacteroidales bacterium]
MEAMIFAAGLGTRLRPLTDDKPKALVEIDQTTLLDINIRKLIAAGCSRIVINVHHFAQKVIQYIETKDYAADIRISDESSLLLDTGGGLLNARNLFSSNQNIILHNVDIISDVDLGLLERTHLGFGNAIATLAVSKRHSSRQILFNGDMQLSGWQNDATHERIITRDEADLTAFGFSGIAVVSPSIFDLLHKKGAFPIMNRYLDISREHCVKGFVHSAERWLDVGKISSLPAAEKLAKQLNITSH